MLMEKGRVTVRVGGRQAAVFIEIEKLRVRQAEFARERSLHELSVKVHRCPARRKSESQLGVVGQPASRNICSRMGKFARAVRPDYSHRAARVRYR
jgi:hypothetical protein